MRRINDEEKTPDAKEQEKIQKLYEEAMKGGEKC